MDLSNNNRTHIMTPHDQILDMLRSFARESSKSAHLIAREWAAEYTDGVHAAYRLACYAAGVESALGPGF